MEKRLEEDDGARESKAQRFNKLLEMSRWWKNALKKMMECAFSNEHNTLNTVKINVSRESNGARRTLK